jgi:CBS domain containing-hemolysin-like protein
LDSHSWLALVLLAGALVLLIFAAAAEAGAVSLGWGHVRLTPGRGAARSSVAHAPTRADAHRERETLLGSLALARSLAVVAASALAFFVVSRATGSTWAAVAIAVAGSLGLLALAEAVARSLVHQSPEHWGARLSPLIRAFRLVFGLPARALVVSGRVLLRRRGAHGHLEEASSEDDSLLTLVEMGQANGGIEAEERAMIRGIIKLVGTAAREIMVPRIDIVAVDTEDTVDDVMALVMERGYSRIPLYEDTIDNVVGVLYAKDFLRYLSRGAHPPSLKDVARPPFFIPESKKVDELLSEMRASRVHMAIVVDEYGGTAGLVTIEDLLEEIVGEIEDEYDRSEVTIERLGPDEAILDARVSIDDLNELFGLAVEGEDFDTVGGFVYHLLGRVPTPGDEVSTDGLRLRVLNVLGRRIKKVRIVREPVSPEQAASDPHERS